MMSSNLLHSHSPFRIFAISGSLTLIALVLTYIYLGLEATFVAFILILIEITFSFENAIINARVLSTMSRFWQRIFLTVGILIAVFGMRIIFPIVVVMLTAGISWSDVINLALNQPEKYALELEQAHPAIASFGGMFLLMLCLHFFFDPQRRIRWIDIIERPLQRVGKWWFYAAVCFVVLIVISALPINEHPKETFTAGIIGIVTYLLIHGIADALGHRGKVGSTGDKVLKTGFAGFMAFIYLEILDASFSFDGVIGAFAVTQDVILIAIGLGVGAIWVRSLTLFMVRRRTLHAYRYLEHGAHYTIGVLAIVLLVSLFVNIPEVIAGVAGLAIISASVFSSIRLNNARKRAA